MWFSGLFLICCGLRVGVCCLILLGFGWFVVCGFTIPFVLIV